MRLRGLAGWRPGGGRIRAGAWGLDDEDPGGGDGGGHGGRAVTRHAELDTSFLAGAGEAGGILEDLDDLGGRQQDGRPAPAGAVGVGSQHLDGVAGPQSLGHVARLDLERQLDQARVPAGGEDEPGRDEGVAPDRCGQDPAGHPAVGSRLQVVAERGGWKPDPDDHEIPVFQERAGGQVMGGRVHRDQLLGTVQEQRAGQDREHHETRAERGAAVDPGGRAQAVGWGRRWRLGVQAGQGRRSVGDGAASAEDA